MQSHDGRDMAERGFVEVVGGRLSVTNPLLTDAVQRSLMAATRR